MAKRTRNDIVLEGIKSGTPQAGAEAIGPTEGKPNAADKPISRGK